MNRFFYRAEVLRIVDANTLDLMIDLGFDIHHEVRVRLYGVGAMEEKKINKKNINITSQEKNFIFDWIKKSETIFVQTIKNKRDKDGTIFVRVYSDETLAECLNDDLISKNIISHLYGI